MSPSPRIRHILVQTYNDLRYIPDPIRIIKRNKKMYKPSTSSGDHRSQFLEESWDVEKSVIIEFHRIIPWPLFCILLWVHAGQPRKILVGFPLVHVFFYIEHVNITIRFGFPL